MAEQIFYELCCSLEGSDLSKHAVKNLVLYTVQLIINANPTSNPLNSPVTSTMDYWMDVKGEIEKM